MEELTRSSSTFLEVTFCTFHFFILRITGHSIDIFNYFKSPKRSKLDSTRIKVNEREKEKEDQESRSPSENR